MQSVKDEYAIVGIGQTEVGHLPEYSKRELVAETARLAIEDSGVPREEIEATIRAAMAAGSGSYPDYADEFCRILGLSVKAHFKVGRGGDHAAQAIMSAVELIDLGVSDYVLVSAGYSNWSQTHDEERRQMVSDEGGAGKSGLWGREFGDIHAPNHHALLTSRHMHEFGTTHEDLAKIAVAQREWACLNPDAYMHGRPITEEDYHDSPWIVEPYHLLDICLQSDGGAAFLLTTTENAEPDQNPVYLKGLGFGEHIREYWWEDLNYTRLAVDTAKETAFDMADITIDDVDVAQLYDCFTGEVLLQIEDYGWAEKGEAKELLRDDRLGPDGDILINTGGGLLSSHHLSDMTGLIEAVRQLRGGLGKRQVNDAEIGIVSGHGGEILRPGMASHHSTVVLGRD